MHATESLSDDRHMFHALAAACPGRLAMHNEVFQYTQSTEDTMHDKEWHVKKAMWCVAGPDHIQQRL